MIKIASLMFIVSIASITVLADYYSDKVVADSPYGYWRFNETDTSDPADDEMDANDGDYDAFVGSGDGLPTLGVKGVHGTSLDGVRRGVELHGGSPNTQVYISDTTDPVSYSIECWVKVNAGAATSRNIVVRTLSDPTVAFSHQLRIQADGTIRHYTYDGATRFVNGTTVVRAGKWYHLVGIYKPDGGDFMSLWVNGVREGYWSGSLNNPWTGGDEWRVGSIAGGGVTWFDGVIDELAIYHSVLSDSDILEHYEAGRKRPGTIFFVK